MHCVCEIPIHGLSIDDAVKGSDLFLTSTNTDSSDDKERRLQIGYSAVEGREAICGFEHGTFLEWCVLLERCLPTRQDAKIRYSEREAVPGLLCSA